MNPTPPKQFFFVGTSLEAKSFKAYFGNRPEEVGAAWVQDVDNLILAITKDSAVRMFSPVVLLFCDSAGKAAALESLRLMKSSPKFRAVPAVLVMTNGCDARVEEFYDAHCNCCVESPADEIEKQRVIEKLISYWLTVPKLPTGWS